MECAILARACTHTAVPFAGLPTSPTCYLTRSTYYAITRVVRRLRCPNLHARMGAPAAAFAKPALLAGPPAPAAHTPLLQRPCVSLLGCALFAAHCYGPGALRSVHHAWAPQSQDRAVLSVDMHRTWSPRASWSLQTQQYNSQAPRLSSSSARDCRVLAERKRGTCRTQSASSRNEPPPQSFAAPTAAIGGE